MEIAVSNDEKKAIGKLLARIEFIRIFRWIVALIAVALFWLRKLEIYSFEIGGDVIFVIIAVAYWSPIVPWAVADVLRRLHAGKEGNDGPAADSIQPR